MNPNLPGLLATVVGVITVFVAGWETYAVWRSQRKKVQDKTNGTYELSEPPVLQVVGLHTAYGVGDVHDVNIAIAPGEIVALIGPQDSGPSTIFRAVMEQMPPDSGKINFDGHSLLGKSMKERVRLGLTYVHPTLPDPNQSVEKTIRKALLTRKNKEQMSEADIQRILDELLRTFDLVGDREAAGASLIMWKSRNLSFAKILATNPRLLLLDELFSKHSDPEARSVTAFINYAKANGIGMLIAESGIKAEQALMLSDRGYVFANGRIVAEGTRDMLSATPEAQIAINL